MILTYKIYIFGTAAVISIIIASWVSNEYYSAYFVLSGLIFGVIACLLASFKMLTSNKIKVDTKSDDAKLFVMAILGMSIFLPFCAVDIHCC